MAGDELHGAISLKPVVVNHETYREFSNELPLVDVLVSSADTWDIRLGSEGSAIQV